MKKWLRDGLFGWAGGIAAWVLILMFIGSGVAVLVPGIYLVIIPVAAIPGFAGGYLGGRFLKFPGSNTLGGAILTSIAVLRNL